MLAFNDVLFKGTALYMPMEMLYNDVLSEALEK